MNLLITGSCGFIGSCFARRAVTNPKWEKIILLDKMGYASDIKNVEDLIDNKRIIICAISLAQEEILQELIKTHEITHIINFAAESHVDNSIGSSWAFIESNILGTYNLLEAIRITNPNIRCHFVSTDEYYGSLPMHEHPFREESPCNPSSPYSASKAAADCLVNAWCKTYEIQATISRGTNTFGPRQHPEKLIPKTIVACLLGKPIPVYGKGENFRDWIHVEDHCHAVELILEKGQIGEAYLVGCSNEWSNLQIVEWICKKIDDAFKECLNLKAMYPNCPAAKDTECGYLIQHVADRPGHDFRYAADWSKLKFNLQPKYKYMPNGTTYDFDEALKDTVKWYIENKEWWINKI